MLSRKNVSTTIRAVGALTAFYGLLRAYVRAKHDMTVRAWVWWWLDLMRVALASAPADWLRTGGPK